MSLDYPNLSLFSSYFYYCYDEEVCSDYSILIRGLEPPPLGPAVSRETVKEQKCANETKTHFCFATRAVNTHVTHFNGAFALMRLIRLPAQLDSGRGPRR